MKETDTSLIRFKFALMDTWIAISHDVLHAMDVDHITREEVIDIVLDAERIEQHGGLSQEHLRVWNAQSAESQNALAEYVFWEPVYH